MSVNAAHQESKQYVSKLISSLGWFLCYLGVMSAAVLLPLGGISYVLRGVGI
jgi:hypothetical protein